MEIEHLLTVMNGPFDLYEWFLRCIWSVWSHIVVVVVIGFFYKRSCVAPGICLATDERKTRVRKIEAAVAFVNSPVNVRWSCNSERVLAWYTQIFRGD